LRSFIDKLEDDVEDDDDDDVLANFLDSLADFLVLVTVGCGETELFGLFLILNDCLFSRNDSSVLLLFSSSSMGFCCSVESIFFVLAFFFSINFYFI